MYTSEGLENRTLLKETSMERTDLLPSLQSTIRYSPSERKVPKCVLYIHVVRHGHFLLIPMVPASDTNTVSHLGCHTPRLCYVLSRTEDTRSHASHALGLLL